MLNYLLPAGIVVGLIILAINPVVSLFLLSFSTPAINWVFQPYGLEIPFSDLIAALSLGAWILFLLYSLVFKTETKIELKFPLFFPFICFIGANALSLINHPDPLNGFYYLSRWLILLYAAYIFLPANLIKTNKTLRIAVWGLALSSLIVAISGWLSLWGQDWQNSFFRLKSIAFWGIYPFGDNHNLIAEFLSVGAFLWLAIKEWTESERLRRIFKVIFVFILAAAIMTFSRAAWISVTLQLAVYILWRNRQFLKKQGGLVLLVIMAAILLMLPVFWRMKILQAENVSSTENRILLTEIAYRGWLEKPIIGQGSGRFVDLVANNLRFTAKYGPPIDSHGFIQKIMAETGLLGILTWLFLIAVIIKEAILGLKHYGQNAPWLLPLWISAGGGFVFQVFNTSYYKGKVWLIIALALIATEFAQQKYGRKD